MHAVLQDLKQSGWLCKVESMPQQSTLKCPGCKFSQFIRTAHNNNNYELSCVITITLLELNHIKS